MRLNLPTSGADRSAKAGCPWLAGGGLDVLLPAGGHARCVFRSVTAGRPWRPTR